MRTAAYCRFSSDAQRETSIRDQYRNCCEYASRHGWHDPVLYQDQAISGSRSDRPGYRALLAAAEAGMFDVLIIDDMSRLSRDHIETATAIRRLKFANVRVIGVSDGTDTARDNYKLETGLRGLMSELYLDDLAKKTHRGLTGQALDGYSAGGMPYGYTSSSDGNGHTRAINEDEAKWVRHIYQRYVDGYSCRQIAHELNTLGVPSPRGGTWKHSAIYPDGKGLGILGNPIYGGKQIWNRTAWVKDPITGRRRRTMRPMSEWIITDVPDQAIIPPDLMQAVEARRRAQKRDTSTQTANGKNSGGRGPKFLFSGLLKCGVCGGAYVIQGRRHYGCATHKNAGPSVCSNKLKVLRSTIETVLLAKVRRDLLNDENYREFEMHARAELNAAKPDTSAIRRRMAEAKRDLDNLMAAIKAGIITPTTKQALEQAEHAMREAREELDQVDRFEPTQMLPRAREIYRDWVARVETMDDIATARETLRIVLGEIRLIPENGTLTAEMQSAGLAGALHITLVAGARNERYSTPVIRIPGLK